MDPNPFLLFAGTCYLYRRFEGVLIHHTPLKRSTFYEINLADKIVFLRLNERKLLSAGKIAYYNKLKRIGKMVSFKPERLYPIVRTRPIGPESSEHYLLKKFLAKCLVDKPQQHLNFFKIVREERYKHIGFKRSVGKRARCSK